MKQILDLLGFQPNQRTGDQWYGACPLHDAPSGRTRHFSVHAIKRRYCCHKCRSRGNHLELWAAFTKTQLHPAMIDLCHALSNTADKPRSMISPTLRLSGTVKMIARELREA